ncbi:hypothetical protein D3C87_1404850 [compost metagenome]
MHSQGMIADNVKRRWNVFEQAGPVVNHCINDSVHWLLRVMYRSTEMITDSLMAQTNP